MSQASKPTTAVPPKYRPTIMALLTGLSLLASLAIGPAPAQTRHYKKPRAEALEDDAEFASRKLTAPADLPYFPDFPQKKFLDGQVKPQSVNGPGFIEYFQVKEPPSQVLDWYKTALGSNRWVLKQSTPRLIDAAHPDGHTCIVLAQYMTPEYDDKTKKFVSATKLSVYFHMMAR